MSSFIIPPTIGPRPAHVALALDTNIVNAWRASAPATVKLIEEYIAISKGPPALTSTTVFEMFYGFENGGVLSGIMSERTNQDIEALRVLISDCTVLPFDQKAAEIAAYIYPRLSEKNKKRHWRDLFIAATAIAHNYGVATRNSSDFELIRQHTPPNYPSLHVATWEV